MDTDKRCPRCNEGKLRVWDELGDEEREVVIRLPASADYAAAAERYRMNRWCTRCWYEETKNATDMA